MVFLFNDTQLKMEQFLEDINNILNTGEVGTIISPLPNSHLLQFKTSFCFVTGKLHSYNLTALIFDNQLKQHDDSPHFGVMYFLIKEYVTLGD